MAVGGPEAGRGGRAQLLEGLGDQAVDDGRDGYVTVSKVLQLTALAAANSTHLVTTLHQHPLHSHLPKKGTYHPRPACSTHLTAPIYCPLPAGTWNLLT